MEAKRALMIAKLDQRHKKRSPTETTGNGAGDFEGIYQNGGGDLANFQHQFYSSRSSIFDELELLKIRSDASIVVERKLDELSDKLSKLQLRLNETTSVLSAYEIRRANASLQELQENLNRFRTDLRPQKRFAFTNIKPIAKSSIASTNTSASALFNEKDAVDGSNSDRTISFKGAVVLQNRKDDDDLILSKESCRGKDVLLLECKSCTIRLLGVATTLHAKRLVDCVVICSPVSTSIFVESCEKSIFLVACQQLRMHSSFDCDLYLHVTTRAIIEDCRRLRFAPYSLEDVDQLFLESNLDQSVNHWDQIQDFHWLVVDKPSPNWVVLPIADRRGFSLTK